MELSRFLCPSTRTLPGHPAAWPPGRLPQGPESTAGPTHVFVRAGVLGLRGVGGGGVAVGAVVLTLVVRRPVVRDEEQLLDVALGKDESP